MQVVETVADTRTAVARARQAGQRIGFVPTMGALHEGHLSLVSAARGLSDFVVVSIFVNPTQFGPHEDFARYPRPRDKDLALCEQAGVDLVFLPPVEELYSPTARTIVEVQGLSDVLEGAVRPGHFRGVATVVTKLFGIVLPDVACFGQKDYQQQAVLHRMTRELNLPVEVVTCPTLREADGLAMSSRNAYLTAEQRAKAAALSASLRAVEQELAGGERELSRLHAALRSRLEATEGMSIDYALLADPDTLEPLTRVAPRMVGLLAVRLGTTRLIDCWVYDVPDATDR